MYHFFGYDRYERDYEYAISMLKEIEEHLLEFQDLFQYAKELHGVLRRTRELHAYAQNNRLE